MSITLAIVTLVFAVWFDGTGPIYCHADTGSPATIIRQSVANRIGTLGEPLGSTTLVGVGGGDVQGRTYRVNNVGTRYMGWVDGRVLVLPDNRLPFDCLFGTDFLAQQPIIVDWREQEIRPMEWR